MKISAVVLEKYGKKFYFLSCPNLRFLPIFYGLAAGNRFCLAAVLH